MQNNYARKSADYEEVHSRRNPYLVEYEERLRSRRREPEETGSRDDDFRRTTKRNGQRNIVPMTERRPVSFRAARSLGTEERDHRGRRPDAEERDPRGRQLDAEKAADPLSLLYGSEETGRPAPDRQRAASVYGKTVYEGKTGVGQRILQTAGRTGQRGYGQASPDRGLEGRRPVRRYTGRENGMSADPTGASSPRRRRTEEDRPSGRGRTAGCAVCEGKVSPERYGVREKERDRAARRKKAAMQRLMVAIWVLCAVTLAAAVYLGNHWRDAAAAEKDVFSSSDADRIPRQTSGELVQGLPAEVFARHPDWEENFLTPNEYSRPGDALGTITNIFVHYTANPGTSAAQNRSYFEQQKDTHEISVSAHFIIGYEGEIIQCVPLDEIAYAVMTRNFDSISIECCYLEEDGSFTQETYDSLISLLAWLTDAYQLDTDDILRHYDCGGKKCPLYYTEHEDAWEQLKKDVDKL